MPSEGDGDGSNRQGARVATRPGAGDPDRRRRRLELLADMAALGAVVAALGAVALFAASAPGALVGAAWAALLADLVVLRVAGRRLRHLVETVPRSLPAWARPVDHVTAGAVTAGRALPYHNGS